MSTLDGTHLPPVIGPSSLPADTPVTTGDTPAASVQQGGTSLPPTASNSSGLLQNFILPKTTLDALGLLRPSNQGDSEILVSQAFLTAERLADESEASEASALSSLAATQAAILAAFQLRLASLQAANNADRAQIDTNNTQIEAIDTEIGEINGELGELETQRQDLETAIAGLDADDPQLAALQQQLDGVNNEIARLDGRLDGLEGEQNRLTAENARLGDAIDERQQEINQQSRTVALINTTLERLIAATDGVNQSVDAVQEESVLDTGEVILEERLPDMQQIFEIDLEDIGLETTIAEARLDDRAVEDAVTVSFGLVGSFFESLGLFLQLSNLVELDLDSTAFGNNNSQRMQISV